MADFDPSKVLGSFKVPSMPPLNPMVDLHRNQAKLMHERVVRSIIDFENKLDVRYEIGAKLVNFTDREIIHIDDVGYWGADMLIFYGRNADGKPVQLLQNVSQLSVLLVAMPKVDEKPRRIGFELQKKLDQAPNDNV